MNSKEANGRWLELGVEGGLRPWDVVKQAGLGVFGALQAGTPGRVCVSICACICVRTGVCTCVACGLLHVCVCVCARVWRVGSCTYMSACVHVHVQAAGGSFMLLLCSIRGRCDMAGTKPNWL